VIECLGSQKFTLRHTTPLPMEISYGIDSKDAILPTVEFRLIYCNDELQDDDIPLDQFILKKCPNADVDRQVRV